MSPQDGCFHGCLADEMHELVMRLMINLAAMFVRTQFASTAGPSAAQVHIEPSGVSELPLGMHT